MAPIKWSLANLAVRALSELETLLRRRLKALQYRRSTPGGLPGRAWLSTDRTDPSCDEVSMPRRLRRWGRGRGPVAGRHRRPVWPGPGRRG